MALNEPLDHKFGVSTRRKGGGDERGHGLGPLDWPKERFAGAIAPQSVCPTPNDATCTRSIIPHVLPEPKNRRGTNLSARHA